MIGQEFEHLCRLVKDRTGLHLTGSKMRLVSNRLLPIAQRLGHRSVLELLQYLQDDAQDSIVDEIICVLGTHESSFFRDPSVFASVRRAAFPALMRARHSTKHIRVWSAACSTGQEPYSIAMLAAEMGLDRDGWQIDILATDISDPVLARANAGCYSEFEARRGLDEERIVQFFNWSGSEYEISPSLRHMVEFRKHNLLADESDLGRFDIIFCRNVLMYFDGPTRKRAFSILAKALMPDGMLVLGSSESPAGSGHAFVPCAYETGLFRHAQGNGWFSLLRAANG